MWHCVSVHIDAVLWSVVLHAALHSAQPLQPLHQVPFTLLVWRHYKSSPLQWHAMFLSHRQYRHIYRTYI